MLSHYWLRPREKSRELGDNFHYRHRSNLERIADSHGLRNFKSPKDICPSYHKKTHRKAILTMAEPGHVQSLITPDRSFMKKLYKKEKRKYEKLGLCYGSQEWLNRKKPVMLPEDSSMSLLNKIKRAKAHKRILLSGD